MLTERQAAYSQAGWPGEMEWGVPRSSLQGRYLLITEDCLLQEEITEEIVEVETEVIGGYLFDDLEEEEEEAEEGARSWRR